MSQVLAFLGGTGAEGQGLALRLGLAGHPVVIGSRDPQRAEVTARHLRSLGVRHATGADNLTACLWGEVVFVTVPYPAQAPLLSQLAPHLRGKLVVTTVAPVELRQGRFSAVPVPEGSAGLQARSLLPHSSVASAFHHVSARDLQDTSRPVEGDVLIFADDRPTREAVSRLVSEIQRLRPVVGGGLSQAGYAEAFTALLLNLNRRYRCRASLRFLGLQA